MNGGLTVSNAEGQSQARQMAGEQDGKQGVDSKQKGKPDASQRLPIGEVMLTVLLPLANRSRSGSNADFIFTLH